MCKKISGKAYDRVGGFLTVDAVAPTSWLSDNEVITGTNETLTMSGGSGLKLMASGGDAAKVVASTGSCRRHCRGDRPGA